MAKPKTKAAARTKRRPPSLVGGIVRALLPLNILELLVHEPQHGLGIAGHVGDATAGAWSPSAGTLYPMLQRMEDDGLISSTLQRSTGAPRRVYRITSRGRRSRQQLRRDLVAELTIAKDLVDTHLEVLGSDADLSPHSEAEMKAALRK